MDSGHSSSGLVHIPVLLTEVVAGLQIRPGVRIIDGTVNGIARGTVNLSQALRKVQTGVVSNYALAIAFGMVAIIGIYLVGFSSLDVPFLR